MCQKIILYNIFFVSIFFFGILGGDNRACAAPTKVLHFGFESSDPTQPSGKTWELGCSGNCPVVTTEKARVGSRSVKTVVDRLTSPTMYRTEFTHYTNGAGHMEANKGTATQDYWMGFSVYIPDSYVPMTTPTYEIFFQTHASPPDDNWTGYNGLNPNLGFRIYPSSASGGLIGFDIKGNNDPYPQTASKSSFSKRDIPYQTNRWYDFVIHARFDSVNGFTKVWMDGKQIVDFTGSNYFRGHGEVYPKFGMYNGWRTRDIPGEVVKTRTLYHDEYRFAYGPDANYYSYVAPGGGTSPTLPTSSLTTSSSSITKGESITLSWNSTNTTSCTGTNFSTNNKISGSLSLSPTITTSYTLVCTGPGGNITKSVTVEVSSQPQPISPLLLSYAFNQDTGTSIIDFSGNNRTGSLSGAIWTTSGKYENALSFDGINDKVSVPSFLASPQETTYEYWFYVPNSIQKEYARTLQTATETTRPTVGFSHEINPAGAGNNKLKIVHWSGTTPSTIGTLSLATNTWNHIAHVMSGNMATVYLNGIQALSASGTRGIGTAPLTLGAGGSNYINGRIDNLRIYSKSLTQNEIQAMMKTPIGETSPQDPPSLSLKTPPSPVVNNPQSLLEIQTNQSGTLSFTGDCTFTPNAVSQGSTFLTLTPIQKKSYTNCKITLTNSQNQQSTPLTIPNFTLSYRADINKDMKVDIFDFTFLISNFGKNECGNEADLNDDCVIDIFDFTVFLGEFGRGV
ncbi:MAG: hypothetical protein EOM19_02920 [Candidatus Moranbacteria bacterium]|nr:hypothetical protein [Candidatus Moranbacteria bacterium]